MFFFVGFLIAAYLKIPIMGIAFFGVVIVAIMYYRDQKNESNDSGSKAGEDDDDF